MQRELRARPKLTEHISDPGVRKFIRGPDVPDAAFLLGQLDAVDKVLWYFLKPVGDTQWLESVSVRMTHLMKTSKVHHVSLQIMYLGL